MAYNNNLSFEFDRIAQGVSVMLFKRSTTGNFNQHADDSTGI